MGTSIRVSRLFRKGIWLYTLTIINNVFGFLYWFILSRIGGSSLLGLTSSVIGFSSIINGFLSLGLPTSLRKFLGREYLGGSIERAGRYYWSTLWFSVILHVTTGSILYTLGCMGYGIESFTPEMLVASSILVLFGYTLLMQSYTAAVLKTEIAFLATLIGNILKLFTGAYLVLAGYGWFGAVVGYVFVPATLLLIGVVHSIRLLGFKLLIDTRLLREVLIAGISNWIPVVTLVIGQWLGVLVVYGYSGAVEAGYYYIAYVITSLILMAGVSVMSIMLPVLSSMVDGRKRYSYNVLRLSLVAISPAMVYVLLYPDTILRLLGSEYVSASPMLSIMMLAVIPLSITYCVSNLLLAYGSYGRVLAIGLAQNLPRLILYLALTPLYSGFGSAVAFTIGGYTGLFYSLYVSSRIGYRIDYRGILKIVSIPLALLSIPYIIGAPWYYAVALLIASYIVYTRTRVLTRSDIRELSLVFLPEEKIDTIYYRLKPLIDLLVPRET